MYSPSCFDVSPQPGGAGGGRSSMHSVTLQTFRHLEGTPEMQRESRAGEWNFRRGKGREGDRGRGGDFFLRLCILLS